MLENQPPSDLRIAYRPAALVVSITFLPMSTTTCRVVLGRSSDPSIDGSPEVVHCSVRVHHRAPNVPVAHQDLGFMEAGTTPKQVGTEVVPEAMGGLAREAASMSPLWGHDPSGPPEDAGHGLMRPLSRLARLGGNATAG